MSIQSYDSAVAAGSQGQLRATGAAIESSLSELTSFVQRVSSQWEGDEQVLYREIQTKWDNAAQEIKTILDQITNALGTNTENVDSMRGRVRGRLNG